MFENKKIYIAPYSKTSDVLRDYLLKKYKNIEILGFIDKNQKGDEIFNFDAIKSTTFDCILIHSPNHFESIYKDLNAFKCQIFKVESKNNKFKFLNSTQIKVEKIYEIPRFFRQFIFKNLAKFYDNFERKKYVFISKNFINGNNKFLFFAMFEHKFDCVMLTNNIFQLKELKAKKYNAAKLNSIKGHILLAQAKVIIVDQGDNSALLTLKSKKQKTFQLWHGIPLEHMNLLTNITYDYFLSTSDFVSESGFKKVFLAKNFLNFGYARNDILLRKTKKSDLIFTDEKMYEFVSNAQQNGQKIIIYMPTFRESDFNEGEIQISNLGLDFDQLNNFLKTKNAYFIIKFHPFVHFYYDKFFKNSAFSNILFYDAQKDIYPLLKFADILAGDYSSVYYDFLLLDRPILFYLYDHGKCSKMAHGYIYEFDDYSPGKKAYNKSEFHQILENALNGEDEFKKEREILRKKLFDFADDKSCDRIMQIFKEN